jgi:hypothetical protein
MFSLYCILILRHSPGVVLSNLRNAAATQVATESVIFLKEICTSKPRWQR